MILAINQFSSVRKKRHGRSRWNWTVAGAGHPTVHSLRHESTKDSLLCQPVDQRATRPMPKVSAALPYPSTPSNIGTWTACKAASGRRPPVCNSRCSTTRCNHAACGPCSPFLLHFYYHYLQRQPTQHPHNLHQRGSSTQHRASSPAGTSSNRNSDAAVLAADINKCGGVCAR